MKTSTARRSAGSRRSNANVSADSSDTFSDSFSDAFSDGEWYRQHYRPRRWPWFLAIGLVLALVGGTAYVVYRTSVFAVRQVSVAGVEGPVAEQVRLVANQQLGQPLAAVDEQALQTAVGDIPQVASAAVTKDWPDRLQVTVVARVPIATTNANGKWWLLDAEGTPYVDAAQRPAGLLPIELATPGPDDPATVAALAVVKALPDNVSALVQKVTAASPFQITLVLSRDRTVLWGDSNNSARKAQVLLAVLQQDGSVFDLSDPTMVSVK